MPAAARHVAALALVAFLVAVSAGTADALVLKHRTTGEVVQGTLTDEREGRLYGFRTDDGVMRYIDPKQWQIVRIEENDKRPEGGSEGPAAGGESVVAYVMPIVGPIDTHALVGGLEKGLDEAKRRRAGVVIFRIDTPGGRIDLGDRIIRLIGAVDWATTVAWVEGDEKRALSAGAYICLATHKIYMAPGTTIGAATPYRVTWIGSAEVEEKMTSAFRARFRSLAQERGHPSAIADAMVDASSSVVQVWLDGEQQLVTEEEAKRLEKEHKDSDRFKRGKTISKSGKLVTLTSNEALEYSVCSGIADSVEEVLKQMGHTNHRVFEAAWLGEWIQKEARRAKDLVEKQKAAFNYHMSLAVESDPRNQHYVFRPGSFRFADGGRKWQAYTDRALAYLKKCAAALQELEKYSKDERYDFPIPEELFNAMKADMESYYTRLQTQRNAREMP